jgi:hypothetical protein
MQATVDRQAPSQVMGTGWTTRLTNVVVAAQAEAVAREAIESAARLDAADAFDRRRHRLEAIAASVFDRAEDTLRPLGVTTRTTTSIRDSLPRLPRAFDVAFHLDGVDHGASLVLTAVEGYDTVKAVRCLSPRRIGTDVTKHTDHLPAGALADDTVGALLASLVEEFVASGR